MVELGIADNERCVRFKTYFLLISPLEKIAKLSTSKGQPETSLGVFYQTSKHYKGEISFRTSSWGGGF